MGTRAVLKSVIESYPHADINIAIVWINKIPSDSRKAAEKVSGIFNDNRICQFYDSHQLSGRAVADSLGWQGRVAWDIYLFYESGSQWSDLPPVPYDWMHQLKDPWAGAERQRLGDDLVKGLAESMKNLLNQ